MTAGKTIDLTIWTFVGRVVSLLFNTLSRFVLAFLPGAVVFGFHGTAVALCWFVSCDLVEPGVCGVIVICNLATEQQQQNVSHVIQFKRNKIFIF